MSDHDDEQLGFRGHPRNIQYATKAARLLNQTETGIARAVSDEPNKFLERQYGRLLIALDLNFTSDTYDIGEVLVDTVTQAFYADLNRSVGDAFERTITTANQTLADLAAEGQREWVGQLNAIIAVVHEHELYLTKVGQAEAYLVRGPSVTKVSDGLAERSDSGATAKTFLNIANGELEVGDKLLLATPGMFKQFSEQDIRRVLYLNTPAKAIKKLGEQYAAAPTDRLAAIVLELTTIDLISAEPLDSEPDEIILAAPRRHFETLQKFKPLRQDSTVADATDKARKYVDKRLLPAAKRQVAAARHRLATFVANRRGEAPLPPPPRAAAGTPEPSESRGTAQPRQSTGERAKNFGRTAWQAIGRMLRVLLTALQPVGRWLSRLWEKSGIGRSATWRWLARQAALLRPAWNWLTGKSSGGKRVLYRNLIILAAIVLVASLFMSVRSAQQTKRENQVRADIQQVQSLQAKAEASYIIKDTEAARRQISEAQQQANELTKKNALKADVASLQQSLNTSANRINNVVVVGNQPAADFSSLNPPSTLSHLTLAGASLFTTADSGQIFQVGQGSKDVKVASANPNFGGKVKSLTTNSTGDVLALTDKPGITQYDPNAGQSSEVGVTAGNWEPGVAIDTVQQSVYLLSPQDNQIFRHPRTIAEFGKGEPYVQGEPDLKNAIDLVTGAQVYVLKSDGSVQQFSGGQSQGFKLASIPGTAYGGGVALAGNFTTNALFVLDPKNKRVVEFNTKGEYARQFTNDAFADAKDLAVDDKTNTLYVLAGNKLYSVPLAG